MSGVRGGGDWGARGVPVCQRVQLGSAGRYLFLVGNGRRGKLLWTRIDSMQGEQLAAALKGRQQQTDVEAVGGMERAGTGGARWRPSVCHC